jgi:hypothetical protein
LLTKVVDEGGLPSFLNRTQNQYETWVRAKVQEAVDDPGPGIPLEEAFKRLMADK